MQTSVYLWTNVYAFYFIQNKKYLHILYINQMLLSERTWQNEELWKQSQQQITKCAYIFLQSAKTQYT